MSKFFLRHTLCEFRVRGSGFRVPGLEFDCAQSQNLKLRTPNPKLRTSSSPTFTCQHELIAFGIYAHRKMRWFTPFRLRFATQTATPSHDFPRRRKHIGHLKTQSGPSPPTFPSPVNPDGRAAYNHLTDNFRFSHDFAVEDVSVKSHRSLQVNSPDDILHTLDLHWMRVWSSEFGVRGSEFGVRSSGFGVRSSGFGVRGSGLGVGGWELGVGVAGSGFGGRGSGFGLRSSGFGVRSSGFGVRGSEFGVRSSGSEFG